ncbi:phospholipase D/nuclease [Backusella circina FSU 941]|nr:phospholipase D/nuclease [Backusella circina FSU 941]
MDTLYELFCMPKSPEVTFDDLKNSNYNTFIEQTMASASHIMKNESLRVESTGQVYKLISNKSNSPTNTMKTLNSLFDAATKNATFGRERALIEWLQVCVKATVEAGLNIPVEPPSLPTSRGIKQSKPKKKTSKDNDEAEWVEEEEERYELIGESDDDYVPSSDHDAVVPKTKKKTRTQKKTTQNTDEKTTEPKKTTRKKKTEELDSESEDQAVPSAKSKPKSRKKQVATLPLLDEGAGSKKLATYYTSLTNCDALTKGNFVKSFFFPSPDSFNAFLSALNSAQETIDICVFAFTDDDVADILIAAKKRNVKIRIITDNQQAAGVGADAKRLQESYGIPYKTDNTTGYMHNKFAIIDSKTLVNGSFNWSKGARFKNRENILVTNIPICIKEFQAQFDSLWEEFDTPSDDGPVSKSSD